VFFVPVGDLNIFTFLVFKVPEIVNIVLFDQVQILNNLLLYWT